jgi:hypothetical protein
MLDKNEMCFNDLYCKVYTKGNKKIISFGNPFVKRMFYRPIHFYLDEFIKLVQFVFEGHEDGINFFWIESVNKKFALDVSNEDVDGNGKIRTIVSITKYHSGEDKIQERESFYDIWDLQQNMRDLISQHLLKDINYSIDYALIKTGKQKFLLDFSEHITLVLEYDEEGCYLENCYWLFFNFIKIELDCTDRQPILTEFEQLLNGKISSLEHVVNRNNCVYMKWIKNRQYIIPSVKIDGKRISGYGIIRIKNKDGNLQIPIGDFKNKLEHLKQMTSLLKITPMDGRIC